MPKRKTGIIKVVNFKRRKEFGDKQLISDIINPYYDNNSFIPENLCKLFTKRYREQANP